MAFRCRILPHPICLNQTGFVKRAGYLDLATDCAGLRIGQSRLNLGDPPWTAALRTVDQGRFAGSWGDDGMCSQQIHRLSLRKLPFDIRIPARVKSRRFELANQFYTTGQDNVVAEPAISQQSVSRDRGRLVLTMEVQDMGETSMASCVYRGLARVGRPLLQLCRSSWQR